MAAQKNDKNRKNKKARNSSKPTRRPKNKGKITRMLEANNMQWLEQLNHKVENGLVETSTPTNVRIVSEELEEKQAAFEEKISNFESSLKSKDKKAYSQVRKLSNTEVRANLKDVAKRNGTTMTKIMRRALDAQAKLQAMSK